jgi:uncharacterized damage-inducible protein DinB
MEDTSMPSTLQKFLVAATEKAAADLAEAFSQLPVDKRPWKPSGDARSAFDLIAECAVLNGYTEDFIQTRSWSTQNMKDYERDKSEIIAQGWDTLHRLLVESAHKVAAVISAVPDTALGDEIEMPGTPQTVAQIIAYPYWNMTYHLGQINYIASLLGGQAQMQQGAERK